MPFLCILLSEIPFYTSFILMFCQMFPPWKSVSSQRKVTVVIRPHWNGSAPLQRSSFWHSNVISFSPTRGVTVFDAVQDFSINVFVHYHHKTSMYIKHLMGDLLNYYNAVLFTWFAHLHHVTAKLKPPLALASRWFRWLMFANRVAATALKTKTK